MVLYKVRSVGHEGTSAFTHTFTFSYVSLEIRRRRSFRSLSSPRLASPPQSIHSFKSYSSQFYVANLRLNNVILFTSGDE